MALPPEAPQTIVLSAFEGLKNTVARERLQLTELEAARNVDLDDVGQPRRRRGYTLVDAANYHSIRALDERVLAVRNGELGEIEPGLTFRGFGFDAGAERLTYAEVGDTIYFSSPQVSGKVRGDSVTSWGTTDGTGRWVSPVVLDTDTLGQIYGKVLKAPPLADEIAYYRGRIYLAAGPYLWATELYLYDHVDPTRNFLQFEAPITMLAPVEDGIFVGTERAVYFLSGSFTKGMPRQKLLNAGAVRGSAVTAAASLIGGQQGPAPEGSGVMFLTPSGICAGLPGGSLINRTSGRVEFPAAAEAAALYRDDSGATSYVAVTNSGGSPVANARIGDYCDAEIVRRV